MCWWLHHQAVQFLLYSWYGVVCFFSLKSFCTYPAIFCHLKWIERMDWNAYVWMNSQAKLCAFINLYKPLKMANKKKLKICLWNELNYELKAFLFTTKVGKECDLVQKPRWTPHESRELCCFYLWHLLMIETVHPFVFMPPCCWWSWSHIDFGFSIHPIRSVQSTNIH